MDTLWEAYVFSYELELDTTVSTPNTRLEPAVCLASPTLGERFYGFSHSNYFINPKILLKNTIYFKKNKLAILLQCHARSLASNIYIQI